MMSTSPSSYRSMDWTNPAFIPRGLWPPPPARQIPRPFRGNRTSTFQPPLLGPSSARPCCRLSPCQCLYLSFLSSSLSSSSYKPPPTMVLLAALFLALVLLASLANVLLLRVPPKKLPALLRTLFAQPPPAAPGKVDGGPPPPPPPPQKQQQKKKERRGVSAELRRVFATFDKNGDGLITREELRESLRGLQISVSDEEVEEAVAGSDANGDGRIDLDEFCGLLESMSAVGSAVGSSSSDRSLGDGECGGEEAELKEAFDVFDRNGDGVITVEELEGVLSSLGMSEGKRAKACEEMIRKVDVDGDGMVNFDEFKRMMRGGQALLVSA